MKTWTVRQMQAEGACYSVEQIRALWGKNRKLSLAQILVLDIPAADRMWVVWRPESLTPQQRQTVIERIVTRAVRMYALPALSTQQWATRWLTGEDRTREAAWAAEASWAAAEAAASWAAGVAAEAWVAAAGPAARAAARAEAAAAWAAAGAEYDRQIQDVLDVLNG
jgi:hypothetical protein